MTEALAALVGALVVGVGLCVRALWRLGERVSRLEGRLNGRHEDASR